MHNTFTVAGMSSSTSSHHSPNMNPWGSSSTGGPLASSFGDPLSQSRSHYQPGYLLSSSQNDNAAQGNQRVDEVPVVKTKAKMNQILSRGSTTDFGMDSMFQSSRQRQTYTDEDAPPTSSINDIPNENNFDQSFGHFQPQKPASDKSPFTASRRAPALSPLSVNGLNQPIYIIVFGYPPDKYSVTVEYFKSLGAATDPDPHTEIGNCFKIGYYDGGDAMRAVRKNGEVLGGSFMIGTKWADAAQAEALLGQPVARSNFVSPSQIESSASTGNNAMAVDEPHFSQPGPGTPTVGTPIKLAPSMSAFRKTPASKPTTPRNTGWTGSVLPASASAPNPAVGGVVQPSPSKSVMGQMSDLIFGW